MAQRRSFRRRDSPTGGPGHGYGPLVTRANSIGGVVGGIGACVGGAAALTAVVPTSALWTSRFVCDGPNKMMIDTANYSYKPGQSSTTNTFQCLVGNGVREAGFWSITALQTVLVALLLGGVLAVGWVIRRLVRRQSSNPAQAVLVGGTGAVAVVVAIAILGQSAVSESVGVQMPQGGSLTVHGNGETKTIACNDGHLTVDGRDETVTITGHCAQLLVDGVIHHITVDSADAIDVNGLNNIITFHSGAPKITNSGFGNAVTQG
jgi:hypothetical protein